MGPVGLLLYLGRAFSCFVYVLLVVVSSGVIKGVLTYLLT